MNRFFGLLLAILMAGCAPRAYHRGVTNEIEEGLLRRVHTQHDKEWFGGKLPLTIVYLEETPGGDEGETVCAKDNVSCAIYISPHFNPGLNEAKFTLFHEECHEAHPDDFTHGPTWQGCMKDLAARDAFDELW